MGASSINKLHLLSRIEFALADSALLFLSSTTAHARQAHIDEGDAVIDSACIEAIKHVYTTIDAHNVKRVTPPAFQFYRQ